MGKLKFNVIPPLEGSPAIYPTERAHDATSVLAWLENTCGDGILIDNEAPIHSDPMRQLDAGEYTYYRTAPEHHYYNMAPEDGERHIAPTP